MLQIGNIYGHGFGAAELAAIERAGFVLRRQASHYAGGQVCRFIDFEDGPALELIDVEDPKAYLDFVPDGMTAYSPGINLVVPEWAERELEDFEQKHDMFRPYRLHVPYDGSERPSAPGWNYLNFATPLLPGVFIWLTRLDPPEPRKPFVPRHLNGVSGVRGLVVRGNADSLRHVARVAEVALAGGAVTIEGVTLWPETSLEDLPKIRRKAFPLLAVVLETADLRDVPPDLRRAGATSFEDGPAVHLPLGDLSWDLLITEADLRNPLRRFPTAAAEAPRYAPAATRRAERQ